MSSSRTVAKTGGPDATRPSSPHAPEASRARFGRSGFLVMLLALVAMARLCTADFTWWDDAGTIHQNPRLNPPTLGSLAHYWTHREYGLYIPGTYTVWSGLAWAARLGAPDERGIQLNPWVFHTTSVLLHALAAGVLFALLRRLRFCEVAALFGAAIFAAHPVQVETVGWVSGMKDVLCGLFVLVALWQYVDAVQERRRGNYAIATAALVWAILCKPTAVVAPAMALLIDWLILERRLRDALRTTALWWVLAVAGAIVAKIMQPGHGIDAPAILLRPLIAADAIAFYLWKLLVPLRLCIDYGRTPRVAWEHGWLAWTWIVPAGVAALLAWWRNRRLVAAALVFVVALAPTLGFTPFLFQYYSTVADHYLYIPMIGAAVGVAWVIQRFRGRATYVIAGAAIAVLVGLSWRQSGSWQTDDTLFAHSLSINPNSFLSYNNLGTAYEQRARMSARAADLARHLGQAQAEAEYREEARAQDQRAAELFVEAIRKRRAVNGGVDDYVTAHENLGVVLARLGRAEEGIAQRELALRMQLARPAEARGDVVKPAHDLARDLLRMGRNREALAYYDWVLKADPNNAAARAERAMALQPTTKP